MVNVTSAELNPGFRRATMGAIKGTRTQYVITLNPNKVSPGEELYIDIPKLKSSSCLVPGSLEHK